MEVERAEETAANEQALIAREAKGLDAVHELHHKDTNPPFHQTKTNNI